MPTFDEDLIVNGIVRASGGFRPSSNDWEIARNGEHLEIREPEQSNKVWARFNDDRSLHLIGTPNLHIDGNIGIGTTSPQAKLEVQAPWSDWMFLNQQRDTEGGGGFHIHNPWGNSDQPQGDPSRNRLEIGYRTADGRDLWGQFVLHGPTGNVGIGTVTPQAKLDVNGDIKVKDWTLSVPDYVFEQNYKLRNLDELRDYIASHKHLPEMPSAQTIGEEGVNLGEFCMSLLKKVEELSLYVLQQDEIIQGQNKRLSRLECSASM